VNFCSANPHFTWDVYFHTNTYGGASTLFLTNLSAIRNFQGNSLLMTLFPGDKSRFQKCADVHRPRLRRVKARVPKRQNWLTLKLGGSLPRGRLAGFCGGAFPRARRWSSKGIVCRPASRVWRINIESYFATVISAVYIPFFFMPLRSYSNPTPR